MNEDPRHRFLRKLTIIFLVLFNTYYIPIDGGGGLGPLRYIAMGMAVAMFPFCLRISKALVFGFLYLAIQYAVSLLHAETIRWSTLLYSAELVLVYISLYNLIYGERIFTIDQFIKFIRWLMIAYFGVFIVQQALLVIGIKVFPLLNMVKFLDRGYGCNSLALEPSHFARTMLVCYYAYVKCNEYKRGQGPFSVRELFTGKHRFITCIFLYMMCTMGSGTAFGCLIAFAAYFVRRYNWYYMVPTLLIGYFLVLPHIHNESLERATRVTAAASTLDQSQVAKTDGSASTRISPYLNSLKVDFTKKETWLGYGVDYAASKGSFVKQTGTLFDDYGLVFYIASLVLELTCGYRFFSLAFLFCMLGVGGGSGGNIHLGWALMILMTFVRYFYEYQSDKEVNPGLVDLNNKETDEDA